MRLAVIGIVASLGAAPGWAQAGPPAVYVRQIDYVVQSLSDGQATCEAQSLFLLYVGSPETEEIDRVAERSGVLWSICLVHPASAEDGSARVPAGAAPAVDARDGWYVTETDTRRGLVRRAPLTNRGAWRDVPVLARKALRALGPQDENLILISWNGLSGSLSVFYAPKLQGDRPFHERRLKILQDYLEAHRGEDDVPFDTVGTLETASSS